MECSKLYLDAIRWAAMRHALNNYDGKPYYVHFEDLEQVLRDHNEDDEKSLIQANCHDAIEDGGVSYNDIKKKFGLETAEVVYLCSDNKGRNRDARKNQAFYDEIKSSDFRLQATKIKVADRIANTRRSVKNGHGMGDKYKEEYNHFRNELFIPGHIVSMWKELDELMKFKYGN
jgi:(p)ppGpp synthase/HD superfamily hydrolase